MQGPELSSNSTASTGVDRCQTGTCGTSNILAAQRDSKGDSIWGARRELHATHDAMHRASMGVTEIQIN